MINVIETTIEEFEDKIYKEYVDLFPEDERRPLYKIKRTYYNGIEKIYKIILKKNIIGFILLEKIENYPYYLDYFAIFKKYQNNGYGTEAMQILLNKVTNDGLIGEIEKLNTTDINTKKRLDFYKKFGFREVESEYLLYDVLYTPIAYCVNYNKNTIDKICFDYYLANSRKEEARKKCKLIK